MDQLATLFSVGVGAADSYTTRTLTERARWRRTQAERRHQKKFNVYAQCGDDHPAYWRCAGYAHVVEPVEPTEGLQLLAEAEACRST